jgi:hypothetical protein
VLAWHERALYGRAAAGAGDVAKAAEEQLQSAGGDAAAAPSATGRLISGMRNLLGRSA